MKVKSGKALGSALRSLREYAGLTETAASAATGIPEERITAIENGRKPGSRQLASLFRAYGFEIIPVREKAETCEKPEEGKKKKQEERQPVRGLLQIYTDGSCCPNPGKGAWAYVILLGGQEITRQSGFRPNTTNNEMELTAVISALENAERLGAREVNVFTDSQYVVRGYTEWLDGWMKEGPKSVLNRRNGELWLKLRDAATRVGNVSFTWVRGHSGNHWNETCDAMCNAEYSSRGLPGQEFYRKNVFTGKGGTKQ